MFVLNLHSLPLCLQSGYSLLKNIKLCFISFTGTNTLAYSPLTTEMKKTVKSLAPGDKVLQSFSYSSLTHRPNKLESVTPA